MLCCQYTHTLCLAFAFDNNRDVRFTPKSGHVQRKTACPLYTQKPTCAVQLSDVR